MLRTKISLFCCLIFIILAPLQLQARAINLDNFFQNEDNGDGLIFRLNLKASFELIIYNFNFPDKVERTYAHPADSSTGYTDTNLETSNGAFLTLGASAGIGYKRLLFYLGYDYRFNNGGGYHQELCDYGGESYAYTEFRPGAYTLIPLFGIEYFTSGYQAGFYFEVGLPQTSFYIENGHYRWDHHQKVRDDSWQGNGQRYVLGIEGFPIEINRVPVNTIMLDIHIFYENYAIEFYNEQANISIWGFGVQTNFMTFPL